MGPLSDDEAHKVNNSEATLKNPDNADEVTINGQKGLFHQMNKQVYKSGDTDTEDDVEPIDMKFPTGENANWKKILIYIISFPLMASMYINLPDTRDNSSKKPSHQNHVF